MPPKIGIGIQTSATTTLDTESSRWSRSRPVVVPDAAGPSLEELRWRAFRDHVARVGGAPGEAVSDIEAVQGGLRVRYSSGAIYQRADGATAWVFGAIGERYDQLGNAASWLGLPLTDEVVFPSMEGEGRVSVFEHGAIYWWPDTGAIELNDVILHYTGLACFGETDNDQLSDEDEPYVILGVASPVGTQTRSQIYEDVNSNEGRPDYVELYRGKPTGLAIAAQLMEHDFGDPDHYKAEVAKFVEESFNAASAAAAQIPYVGLVLAAVIPVLKKPTSQFLNATLDTGDDHLGSAVIPLTPKQMVVLSARTPLSTHLGVGYNVETDVLGGRQGATYKVRFSLGTL
jgi:hypothetical protein